VVLVLTEDKQVVKELPGTNEFIFAESLSKASAWMSGGYVKSVVIGPPFTEEIRNQIDHPHIYMLEEYRAMFVKNFNKEKETKEASDTNKKTTPQTPIYNKEAFGSEKTENTAEQTNSSLMQTEHPILLVTQSKKAIQKFAPCFENLVIRTTGFSAKRFLQQFPVHCVVWNIPDEPVNSNCPLYELGNTVDGPADIIELLKNGVFRIQKEG
jgi:hypothetical protein